MDEWITIKTLAVKYITKSKWSEYEEKIIHMYYVKKFIGSRIYEELKKLGAKGSKTGFYEYFKKIKKQNNSKKIHQRYETGPGIQAQFDWSDYTLKIGNYIKKVYIFSIILSFSRVKYFIASYDMKQFSIFTAIEKAFRYFNGSTEFLLIDNAKQMVDNPNRNTLKYNQKFLEFLAYYNVKPDACRVKHPWTKGKVERPFSYLENHFIKGNTFESFDDLQNKLLKFTNEVNNKKHKGINDIPFNKFEIEKRYLKSLPKNNFVSMNEHWRKVNYDCLLSFEGNKYSVPYVYASKYVWVRKYLGYKIKIYSQKGVLIAEHNIPFNKGNIIINEEHYKGLNKFIPSTKAGIKNKFINLFPEYQLFVEKLHAQKRINFKYHLGKIISLADIYSLEDIKKALDSSLKYNVYNYDYIFAYLTNNCDIEYKNYDNLYLFNNNFIDEINKKNIKRNLEEYDKIGG